MNLPKCLIKGILTFAALILVVQLANAQDYKLSGKIVDQNDQQPLIGANVAMANVNDTLDVLYTTTNVQGAFTIAKLKKKTYRLSVSYLGYNKSVQNVTMVSHDQQVGSIKLAPKSQELQGVTVVGTPPQAALKGDTTEFNASSFKVTKDAVAEDLIKKMPGVTLENGTVKAQGEDVKKVLVDGKPFFGEDPTLALRNLPAELIDKVQVFDQQSEQSRLTGFNDGQTTKTVNIVTKNGMSQNGQFGRFSAGYGDQDRYNASLSLNVFKGTQRFSVTAGSNNVNQQNFMMSDFLGAMGSGGGMGGGGRSSGGFSGGGMMSGGGFSGGGMMGGGMFGGSSSGLSTINTLGLNYSNTFSKKLTASGSYFYNGNKTKNISISNTETIFSDSSKMSLQNSNSLMNNFNNRLNFRIEWSVDSLNSLIVIPSINFQANTSNTSSLNNQSMSYYSLDPSRNISLTNSNSNSETNGYNISNRMVFQHKFLKNGRTISADLNTTFNERVPVSSSLTDKNDYEKNYNEFTDQIVNTMTSGYTINTRVAYSEPIGKKSLIQLNVSNSYQKNYSYKRSSVFDDIAKAYYKIDTLSNKYLNYFITNRAGLTYMLRGTKFVANAGVELQNSNLEGDQTFPQKADTKQSFYNILPNLQLNYKLTNEKNVIVNYSTSTNPPSISQLQDVVEYSADRSRITMGNPNLKPQYQHSITARLVYVNRQKGTNFFVLFGGSLNQNSIGNSTIDKGSVEYVQPVNKGTGYNFRSMANYGFALKFIRSNMNLSGMYNLSKTPGFVNGFENIAISNTITQSITLSSNISEKLDFTISTSGSYNFVNNSVNTTTNNNYYSLNSNFRLNWIIWKGFTLQNEIRNNVYKGMSSSSFNQSVTTVNAGVGKKFLKNQAAELRFTAYDLFNKNTNISRTVSENRITDSQGMALNRYFQVSFLYTFRNFKGNMPGRMGGGGFPGGPMPMMP
ncbi:MAG TPA: TonB-dependent receptor [Bacteroidales bacterium]|nr:TonB-dependent receptor [Bacteroidales bacterium]